MTVDAPADTDSGDLVSIGAALFGVAAHDAKNGADLTISTGGVYDLPALAADDWSAGAKLYREATAGDDLGKLTDTEAGNLPVGVAVEDKAANATSARVRLNPAFRPVARPERRSRRLPGGRGLHLLLFALGLIYSKVFD